MVNSFINRHQLLAQWLYRLVEILRIQGGSSWETLVATVSGKTAIIKLDDLLLQLWASESEPLQVHIEYPIESEFFNFYSDAETIRAMIAGQLTLDKALATGQIYLRGNLRDLLGIHQLVMEILADSPFNPQLQELWDEFEQHWLIPNASTPCYCLQQQQTTYSSLIDCVPEDVLLIEITPS